MEVRHFLKRYWVWIMAAIIMPLVIAEVVFFESNHQNTFFSNIYLGTETVGGKSYDEVLKRVKLVGDALKTVGLELVVPVNHSTTTITIPQRSTGLTPDVVVEYFSVGDYEDGGFFKDRVIEIKPVAVGVVYDDIVLRLTALKKIL